MLTFRLRIVQRDSSASHKAGILFGRAPLWLEDSKQTILRLPKLVEWKDYLLAFIAQCEVVGLFFCLCSAKFAALHVFIVGNNCKNTRNHRNYPI